MAEAADAFLSAACHAQDVLCDRLVAAAWLQPSALALMDVGTLAGHLYLVVRRVDKHLDADPTPARTESGHVPILRIDELDDLQLPAHQQVRDDGSRVRDWGWVSVGDAYRERLHKLTQRLDGPLPDRVNLGAPIDFSEYLASRVVEVLVHTDDLASSVGLDTPPPPSGAADVALEFLLRAAREIHGDQALLRTFARRERVTGSAPCVY